MDNTYIDFTPHYGEWIMDIEKYAIKFEKSQQLNCYDSENQKELLNGVLDYSRLINWHMGNEELKHMLPFYFDKYLERYGIKKFELFKPIQIFIKGRIMSSGQFYDAPNDRCFLIDANKNEHLIDFSHCNSNSYVVGIRVLEFDETKDRRDRVFLAEEDSHSTSKLVLS